jgi:hypothetical protein
MTLAGMPALSGMRDTSIPPPLCVWAQNNFGFCPFENFLAQNHTGDWEATSPMWGHYFQAQSGNWG